MKAIATSVVLTSFTLLGSLLAQNQNLGNLTIDNNFTVTGTNGRIATSGGQGNIAVQGANGYIVTNGINGYLSVNGDNGFVQTTGANGYIRATGANGFLSAAGYASIGNFLRVGGNTNNPAAKSVQIGQYATAGAFNALVVGQYNVNQRKVSSASPSPTPPSASQWNADDPIFEVGIGSNATATQNALTIYKDGTITISKPQGDILMGQFGN